MKKTSTWIGAGLAGAALLAAGAGLAWRFVPGLGAAPLELQVFEDITETAGLAGYRGMTHGAAWGDFDGDGRPDLYVTNHLNTAQLFRNVGGGRFAEVTAQVFLPEQLKGDKHGAAWADFDNNGTQDLVQLTGAVQGMGAEAKRLFRNEGGRLVDEAEAMGLMNPEGRTRMPLWLDLDGDGRLDLVQGHEGRLDAKQPPSVFMQRASRFEADDAALPMASRSVPFCVLAALDPASRPGLVCRLVGKGTATQVFDLASLPGKSVERLPQTAFEDIAIADFDNDGRMDVFMARKNAPGAVAIGRPSSRTLVASVDLDKEKAGQPAGLGFRAAGPISVKIAAMTPRDGLSTEAVHLGVKALHPAGLSFEVAPDVGPVAAGVPGAQAGVYFGFTAPDRWEVRVTAPRDALGAGQPKTQDLQIAITAAQDLGGVETVGETVAEEAPARLFMNRDGKLVDEGDKHGLNRRLVAGMNVVAADFDNDMHVDLFVLASGDIGRQESLLLLNDGKGHFRAVKGAGGASGALAGVGDSVTTADVDGDGFLDLLVASGGSMGRSLGLPADGGGYRLYRNLGTNGNHWIEIDLQGSRSNRDGIGALVTLTAGGVTQTRLQDGGVHHRGQNHTRLHFGLAKNTRIDKISVRWPSGQVQELLGQTVDRVLRINEPM